jgi:hypothetical protein
LQAELGQATGNRCDMIIKLFVRPAGGLSGHIGRLIPPLKEGPLGVTSDSVGPDAGQCSRVYGKSHA